MFTIKIFVRTGSNLAGTTGHRSGIRPLHGNAPTPLPVKPQTLLIHPTLSQIPAPRPPIPPRRPCVVLLPVSTRCLGGHLIDFPRRPLQLLPPPPGRASHFPSSTLSPSSAVYNSLWIVCLSPFVGRLQPLFSIALSVKSAAPIFFFGRPVVPQHHGRAQCGVTLFLGGAKKSGCLHVLLSSSTLTSKAKVQVSCWGLAAAATSCLKSGSLVIFFKKSFFIVMTLVFILLFFPDRLYKLSESCHHLNRPCVNTVLQPDKNMLEVLPLQGLHKSLAPVHK